MSTATDPALAPASASALSSPGAPGAGSAGPGRMPSGGQRSWVPTVARGGLVGSLLRSPKAVVGLTLMGIFALLALLAPVLAPGDPSTIGDLASEAPSAGHWLGTTAKGQDVLALTLWGARSSLAVGFVVGTAATLIGVVVGLAGAYFGSVVDDVLSLVTNVFLLLPGLPLLVVLAAFLPPGAATVVLVLVVTGWAGSARVLRAQALSIRGKDFVAAAIVSGERAWRIMFREILPNMASVVMGTFLACVIFGIGAQAGLEFLGLGDSSVVSWGTNLYWASNDGALMSGAWWAFVPSGISIALVAFALALVNYGVDEVTNPRLRGGRRRRTSRATPRPVVVVRGAAAREVTR
ncbi:ABC transporter permease [Terrabacter sp. GCM10028922]|uniref:ABC transporter permease n=1 Tax=Terrabacter sp. GCM10028922 TaxID=3273428 RepID=UPI00361C8E0D